MYLHVQVFDYSQILKIFITRANNNYEIISVELDINFTINYTMSDFMDQQTINISRSFKNFHTLSSAYILVNNLVSEMSECKELIPSLR